MMTDLRHPMPLHQQRLRAGARGFTLVELMVAMVLSLFLIGALVVSFGSARQAAQETERLSRLQENIRFASDYLIRDVRNAGFRDVLPRLFTQDELIVGAFAQYGESGGVFNPSELIVRYAGRGSCGQDATSGEILVIVNRYFLDGDDLRCEGLELGEDMNPVRTPRQVTLAAGVSGLNFQFLREDFSNHPTNVCDYSQAALATTCAGVRITLEFDDDPNRQMELIAAFRNPIFNWLYQPGG
jgi:prepilin-type N-terminal cleavage/methylation domain-containing protein